MCVNILGFKIQGLIFEQTIISIFEFSAESFTLQNVYVNLTVRALWPSCTWSIHHKIPYLAPFRTHCPTDCTSSEQITLSRETLPSIKENATVLSGTQPLSHILM